MSGKAMPSQRKVDRRVQRSREVLGDALIGLMQEQAFEKITVQDVLDRADIGRSTFYAHFSDKNDLLLSDVDEFFGLMATALTRHKDKSNRVLPVRELFAHVADSRTLWKALQASGTMPDVMAIGQEHFARSIRQRLGELQRAPAVSVERSTALAHGLAGALLSMLIWWVGSSSELTAEEMDDTFHQMVRAL